MNDSVWNVREKPVPASAVLPKWWKNMPSYTGGRKELDLEPGPTVTVKRCLPVFDSMTAGYVMPLWADIHVTNSETDGTIVKWGTTHPVFDMWNPIQVSDFKIPEEYNLPIFKYLHGWIITTPPGWSCLITHPIAYPDLPFKVITGIIDTDKLITDINTPIVFKRGFQGVIERGTPMFQIIPIKRDNWESRCVQGDPKIFEYTLENFRTKIVSHYGRHLRTPKNYK
jgi:hypothetical protein